MASRSEDNLATITESDESSSSSDVEVNAIDRRIDQRIVYQPKSVSKIQLTRPPSAGSQSKSRRQSLQSETSHPPQAASLYGFIFGTVFGAGLIASYITSMSHISLFFTVVAVFHYLDYLTVIFLFPSDQKPNISFLGSSIDPPIWYPRYYAFALSEFVIIGYIFPSWKTLGLLNYVGLLFVVVGQIVKTSAVFACRVGFSGQHLKEQPDSLVKDGVYSIIRHPYFFGIYWWMVGTQIMLMNPVCLCYSTYSLQRVFHEIIETEDFGLEKAFGDIWRGYRRNTPTWLPLIP